MAGWLSLESKTSIHLNQANIDQKRNNFFQWPHWPVSSLFLSWILMIIILPLSIAFVQAVDNCCSCLCKCCPTQCFPVIERTELQVDEGGNPIIDVEEQNTRENLPAWRLRRWFPNDFIWYLMKLIFSVIKPKIKWLWGKPFSVTESACSLLF